MAGILDFLTGNNAAASPFGALYPSSLTDDDAKRRAAAADLLASMGVSPTNLPTNLPTVSPFGDPSKLSVADPSKPATGFGSGASPFGFAGPGSMNVNPASLVSPAPQPAPVQPSPPASDLSSVNREPSQLTPDSVVPVGDYQMPMFGKASDVPSVAAGPVPAPAMAPAPAMRAPFSLAGLSGGPGFTDRLLSGMQSLEASKGLVPKLIKGAIGFATGQRTDASGRAATATEQALIAKGATVPEVQAAIDNPTLMSALIQQYYGKDKWTVVKTGQDENGGATYMQQNQVDGTLRPIPGAAPGAAAAQTIIGPDGNPIAIPAGANRKEFIKKVTDANADAATGKVTEAQAKASSFAARMQQAESILGGGLQNQGLSAGGKVAGALPVVGNYLQSADYQKYKQAASAFVTAMLRQESGAAINKAEFVRYEKELFPQPGDDESVVQQKAQMRAAAIQQMRRAAGPGYRAPVPASSANGKTSSGVSWSVN